jgi:quercetin dioxygenase-like cupin family protein
MQVRPRYPWTLGAALVAATILMVSGLALASGIGQHDVTRVEDAKAALADGVHVKTAGASDVITSHITIAPGGHTAWHYHPGPHIVQVKAGTVRVYQTDCSYKTYTAGQGFFDPGHTAPPMVHTAHNAEATDAVIVATDIREADKRPSVVVDPQPGACFASSMNGVGALGVTRVEDGKGTIADAVDSAVNGASEVFTGSMTVAPGGHTAWHHHPGPHIVTIKAGTVRVYRTDCTFKTYSAGQAFLDPGLTAPPFIHVGHNAEVSGNVELLITDIRSAAGDKRLAVATEPQPTGCIAAAATTNPAPAPEPATSLPRTS